MDSQFATRVDPVTVKSWESRLGPDVWYALHHYCAGLVLADRAKLTPEGKEREDLFRRVVEEDGFTLARLPETNPMHAEIAAHMALAFQQLGEANQALQYLDVAISGCPKCAVGYHAKATYYRTSGQLQEARRVLQEGDEATGGKSAELHYLLGLVLFDLKDFGGAQEEARQAYALGYPLPGLRNALAKAGHPLN